MSASLIWQGRVFAPGPDEAAEKVRKKWGNGKLTILTIWPYKWYEYIIEVGTENSLGRY